MQQQPAKLVDLDEFLLGLGDGWSRTPEVELRGWTDDDGTHADRVADPTRPGEFVFGPAVVVLEVAPDHGRRLIVRDVDR
jgi:hypothetical protein